jgi:hypothetical protein
LKPAQAGLVYNEENSMKQSIKKYWCK